VAIQAVETLVRSEYLARLGKEHEADTCTLLLARKPVPASNLVPKLD